MGHAYSALLAQDMAFEHNGDFLLRIEDIDRARAKPEWETQIYDDLKWLGLWWPDPVMRQSERQAAYNGALERLWAQGLLYECTCTRADIKAAMSAPQEGVSMSGADGLIYPGTCRPEVPKGDGPRPHGALRLNMLNAMSKLGATSIAFMETGAGPEDESGDLIYADIVQNVGDIVLARRDMGTSYHLSVVVDDATQGITHVVRGQDLFEATKIHVVLQHLLGLPTPVYHHHRLIRDDAGKRLAKRDDARAISLYRTEGKTPEDIRAMTGL